MHWRRSSASCRSCRWSIACNDGRGALGEDGRRDPRLKKGPDLLDDAFSKVFPGIRPGETERAVHSRLIGTACAAAQNWAHGILNSSRNLFPTRRGRRHLADGRRGPYRLRGLRRRLPRPPVAQRGARQASAEQVRDYRITREIYGMTIDRCRPGVSAARSTSSWSRSLPETLVVHQPARWPRGRLLVAQQEPVISRGNKFVLEEGMVLALEPAKTTYHIQDMVWCGGGAAKLISDKFAPRSDVRDRVGRLMADTATGLRSSRGSATRRSWPSSRRRSASRAPRSRRPLRRSFRQLHVRPRLDVEMMGGHHWPSPARRRASRSGAEGHRRRRASCSNGHMDPGVEMSGGAWIPTAPSFEDAGVGDGRARRTRAAWWPPSARWRPSSVPGCALRGDVVVTPVVAHKLGGGRHARAHGQGAAHRLRHQHGALRQHDRQRLRRHRHGADQDEEPELFFPLQQGGAGRST